MTPLTTSSIAPKASGYQPGLLPGSDKTAPVSNHRYIRRPPVEIPKNHPPLSVSALAQEIFNPLTNINLSVEMLGATIKDESLKLYLDIIMRSSIRINSAVNELLKSGD